ncbi:carbohydrate kinase family protein [Baekduia soli]|nr:PfkB family carbohydrate kinase [Baekduia soli]
MLTLCLGEALVDLVCEQPVATLADAGGFVPRLGGAVALLAVAAARRGAPTAMACTVGEDAWGGWLRARLESEGVDLAWVTTTDAPTPVSFVTVTPGGQRSAVRYGGAPRGVADGLGDAVQAAAALVLSSETLVDEDDRERTLEVRERALAAGRPVILHPDLQPAHWRSTSAAVEVLGACVPGAFLVSCTEHEARALTGERDVEAATASLRAAGAGHVVVRLDAGGALLRGGVDREVAGPVPGPDGGAALTGVLLAALVRTGFYPAALAAMLPDAAQAAAA